MIPAYKYHFSLRRWEDGWEIGVELLNKMVRRVAVVSYWTPAYPAYVNPYRVGSVILQVNYVNTLTADGLAPGESRPLSVDESYIKCE